MTLEEFLAIYGYLAIAVGTFLEGESILVLGGIAANKGYLELPYVILYAFLGTLFGDQLYYYIGRFKGRDFVEKFPSIQNKSQKVLDMLYKHQILFILSFRFLYGIRIAAPFMIGASNVKPLKFLILNVIGAFVWAVSVGILGYVFGQTLEIIMSDVKKYQLYIFAFIIFVMLLLWLHNFRKK